MSNLSHWEQESFYSTQDIIIVGGGFMGLWTALSLKSKNSSLHITILEKTLHHWAHPQEMLDFLVLEVPLKF